jgi:hypothetical protein
LSQIVEDIAVERAIARGQEGLPEEQTIAAYRTIYFPAQELHLSRDDPKTAATLALVNDPRIVDGAFGACLNY